MQQQVIWLMENEQQLPWQHVQLFLLQVSFWQLLQLLLGLLLDHTLSMHLQVTFAFFQKLRVSLEQVFKELMLSLSFFQKYLEIFVMHEVYVSLGKKCAFLILD